MSKQVDSESDFNFSDSEDEKSANRQDSGVQDLNAKQRADLLKSFEVDSETVKEHDLAYADCYARPEIHRHMVNDPDRTMAYSIVEILPKG